MTSSALRLTDDEDRDFWEAHDLSLHKRRTVARVRKCSEATLEREAWAGVGIPYIRDRGRTLYRKLDVLKYLGIEPASSSEVPTSSVGGRSSRRRPHGRLTAV